MTQMFEISATDTEPTEESTQSRNLLLSALTEEEHDAISGHLELVELEVQKVVIDEGKNPEFVYFPLDAVVSVVRRVSDGTYIETGTIGREGFAGISALFGVEMSPNRLEIQVPGRLMRMPAAVFHVTLANSASFRSAAGKFVLSMFDQTGQSVICTARHTIQQRCARWLLMAHDRAGSDTFELTHITLARMLDVRRAGVTEAALTLKQAGLIDYKRGEITVLDRAGLEAAACECYGVNQQHLRRLYSSLMPAG
jgi:CRP-like cAMP-binding protein